MKRVPHIFDQQHVVDKLESLNDAQLIYVLQKGPPDGERNNPIGQVVGRIKEARASKDGYAPSWEPNGWDCAFCGYRNRRERNRCRYCNH